MSDTIGMPRRTAASTACRISTSDTETTPALIIEAMRTAHARGAIVSFDLNYREKLWRASPGGAARARDVLDVDRRARRCAGPERGRSAGWPRHPGPGGGVERRARRLTGVTVSAVTRRTSGFASHAAAHDVVGSGSADGKARSVVWRWNGGAEDRYRDDPGANLLQAVRADPTTSDPVYRFGNALRRRLTRSTPGNSAQRRTGHHRQPFRAAPAQFGNANATYTPPETCRVPGRFRPPPRQ